jgi:hypothetical protein
LYQKRKAKKTTHSPTLTVFTQPLFDNFSILGIQVNSDIVSSLLLRNQTGCSRAKERVKYSSAGRTAGKDAGLY